MTADPPAESCACPSCGQPVWPSDNFCEACRAELSTALVSGGGANGPQACLSCPGAPVTPEGYCESCGRKVPSGADHCELDLGVLAGVTDRGRRHSRNEDAMAIATARSPVGQAAIAVVCDGVSTSARPDEAAQAAARAAARVLLTAARADSNVAEASRQAFGAAQRALLAMADGGWRVGAPSATFVSAVLTGSEVTVCWLGDSRAYWLDPSGAGTRQLTSDDSVAQALVSEGLMSPAEALASPAGHVVTGWIGADLSEAEPHVIAFAPDGPGAVLLCSDGLWNYAQAAADLAGLALPGALTDPLGTAAALIAFANEAGGADNITAVLARFPPGPPVPPADPQPWTKETADEPA